MDEAREDYCPVGGSDANEVCSEGRPSDGEEAGSEPTDPYLTSYDHSIADQLRSIRVSIEKGETYKALYELGELSDTHPESGLLHLLKASALSQEGERRRRNSMLLDAIASYKAATRAKHARERTRTDGYLLAMKTADYIRHPVHGLAEESISKFPRNSSLSRHVISSLFKNREVDEALSKIKKWIAEGHDEFYNRAQLGIYQSHNKDYEAAVDNLEKALRGAEWGDTEVHNGIIYQSIGHAYIRMNKKEMADEWHGIGAERGVFLSQFQRSLQNAARPLKAQPLWSPEDGGDSLINGVKLLEENWLGIKEEAMKLLNIQSGLFEPEGEGLEKSGDWSQFTIYRNGQEYDDACQKTPFTCSVLRQMPDATSCRAGVIKFSVMAGGTHVYAHTGPTNCRIRAHLGLLVPPGPTLRVLNQTRKWEEGKVLLFDDSFEHEVWHDGHASRVILLVDFWHPDLTEEEKRTLRPSKN